MVQNRGSKTAFIIELTALFAALVFVTLVFTRVFVMCRDRSDRAAMLNDSVILASAAAELASACPDMGTLQDTMASSENAVGHRSGYKAGANGSSGTVWILARSGGGQNYIVRVTRSSEEGSSYADDVIDVFSAAHTDELTDISASALKEPVYTLEAGSFHGKEAGS